MPGVDGGLTFPADALRTWAETVFRKVGVNAEDARLLTDSLIEANLRGVDTHGVTRMMTVYVKRIQTRVVNPVTRLEVLRDRASTALIHCHNSIGQPASAFAMETAIAKARNTGVAFVLTTHSNHYGAAAYWAMKALDHGMIGFSATNGPASMAPTGGRDLMLGTNPFAVAIPAGKEPAFVLDLATTVVARGRIMLYARQDKALEPGWAFDAMGRPTTDPHEALKGLLAPIGGYKGYGIALAIDMISGVLSGSKYGAHFPGFLADNMTDPTDVGSIFAAIDIDSFMDLEDFGRSMDKAMGEIRSSRKAQGAERIYIPGDIERETRTRRLQEGIPMPEQIVRDLTALGEELGVPLPRV